MSRNRFAIRAALAVTAAAGMALAAAPEARAEHFDALVFEFDNKARIGGIDVECFTGFGPPGCDDTGQRTRVFEGELDDVTNPGPPVVGTSEEPGFFSNSGVSLDYGSSLAANKGHTIEVRRIPNSPVAGASLLYWDGTGSVSWGLVPNSETLDIVGDLGSGGSLDGTNQLKNIILDSTDGSGNFDTHPDFFLNGNGGLVDPTKGFYAIAGRTFIDDLAPSAAWGVVFDFGVEDEELHEDAIASLASIVPEPGTGILTGLGILGLAVGGRRRRSAA